jgi:hypothetical protein
MGRSIDTHSLRTDGSMAIACPEFHDPAGEVFHPLFGRAAFGALGIHGPIIVASSRCYGDHAASGLLWRRRRRSEIQIAERFAGLKPGVLTLS